MSGIMMPYDGWTTPNLRCKNTVRRLQKTPYSAPIPVLPGVHYGPTLLTRWEKNRGKNAEKPAVFSAKKRENRTKTVYFFYPDTKVRVYIKTA
jgi:hypothetical protein